MTDDQNRGRQAWEEQKQWFKLTNQDIRGFAHMHYKDFRRKT